MKKLAGILLIGLCLCGRSAFAGRNDNLGLHLGYDHVLGDTATVHDLGHVGLSLRSLNHTPLELYGDYYFKNGGTVGLKLHIFWTRFFSLYLLDLGVYKKTGDAYVVRNDVHRSFDITGGAGLSLFLWRGLELTGGVRFMFPNPVAVLPAALRGDYTRASEPPENYSSQDLIRLGQNGGQAGEQAIADREKMRYETRLRFAKDVYLDALRSPIISATLIWRF